MLIALTAWWSVVGGGGKTIGIKSAGGAKQSPSEYLYKLPTCTRRLCLALCVHCRTAHAKNPHHELHVGVCDRVRSAATTECIVLSAAIGVLNTRSHWRPYTRHAVCCMFIYGCEWRIAYAKLVRTGTMFRVRCRSGVSAACFDVVTVADSDRQTDMPQHQLWDVVWHVSTRSWRRCC